MRPAWIMGSVAATALLSTTPTFALTAEEAWNAWKSWAESTGGTISTTGETGGIGSIRVTGITMELNIDGTTTDTSFGDMAFNEASDGSVDVTFTDGYQVAFAEAETNSSGTLAVNFATPVLKMSDAAGGRGVDFVFLAETMEISLDGLTENGEPIPADITATLTGVESTYTTDADVTFLDFNVTTDSFKLSAIGEDPIDGAFEFVAEFGSYGLKGSGANFAAIAAHPEDMTAALEAGLAFDIASSSGAGTFAVAGDGPDGTFQMQGTLGSSIGQFTLDQAAMLANATYRDLAFQVAGAEIPFPQVTGAAGELTTNYLIPLTQGVSGQDFGLRVVLGDITVGEEIWSMVDPAGTFPRDPLTVLIDLAGKAKMLASIFDEEALNSPAPPGELEAITLNELLVKAGPAELTGEGAFTFNNADLATFGGFPAPDGAVTLNLSGGNALLDILVTMGLVPEDQAGMARLMTGLIARPGDGPDTLVSEIAVQPDGTILANGAPLPF